MKCSTSIPNDGPWLLGTATLTFSEFDTSTTTTNSLTFQGPAQPLRSPKRAAAYARAYEGGAGTSGNYGAAPSMQQQQKRECSQFSVFSFLQHSLSSPAAFRVPRPSPSPPRRSRRRREELGAENGGNGREWRESFERRI